MRNAKGSRGGAAPGAAGSEFVKEVMVAIGAMHGVTVMRNPVMRIETPSGGYAWTGIGGQGAPDLHVEVLLPNGFHACLWLECKEGEGELSPKQVEWHLAALSTGRHVRTVRTTDEAVRIVSDMRAGRRLAS